MKTNTDTKQGDIESSMTSMKKAKNTSSQQLSCAKVHMGEPRDKFR